ncbi:MAG: hypothetical protein OXG85_04405 [Chloroflexi bacterium]|nr:hypothetical protein [Chloroflexota bacterium]
MRKLFREHLPFFLIIPALIVLMTWPTFYYVLETDTFWLPTSGEDVWFELWEGWYGGQILRGKADLFYADLLFYPQGASLAFHQYTVPHMLVYVLLRTLLPISNAYNLAFLLTLFANALATYVCAQTFIKDRWVCLFAAAVVGISVALRFKSDAQFWTYYTIPLSIYCLHRAIVESKRLYAILCGLAVGLTVYIGFYVLVCLALSVAIYGLYLACSRLRDQRFWMLTILAGIVCVAISAPRLAQMLSDGEQVEAVLAYRSNWENRSKDVLDFIRHPALTGDVLEVGYLGFVPALLVGVGLASNAYRRRMLIWLLLLLVFLVLRAGTFLTIAGVEFPDILLPKHYLNYLFPAIFRGFTGNHHWVLGALLPLAVLACYGLLTLVGSMTASKRKAVALALLALMSLEYYYGPFTGFTVDRARLAFLDWLETADEESIRLINLPMNTVVARRYYNFVQMLSGYPQVEGALNRVLPAAYTYIDGNQLLRTWKRGAGVHCTPSNRGAFESALRQLLADGFTHIIMHDDMYATRWEPHSFASVPAAYADDYALVYRLADLRSSCGNSAMLAHESLPHWRDLALSTEVSPDPAVTVLSVGPAGQIDDDLLDYYSSVFQDWANFVHVYEADDEIAIQSSEAQFTSLDEVLAGNQLILRVADRRQVPSAAQNVAEDKLFHGHKLCLQVMTSHESVAEYFVASDFPCELLDADQRTNVQYANGVELRYVLSEMRDRQLHLYFFWRYDYERDGTQAYSIQVFDAAGQKVQQGDFVIGHDPLEFRLLDLRALSASDYSVKLILYNYHTGVSVSGVALNSGSAFERELELVRVPVE